MPGLDRARIEALIAELADELPGDWLLVGGAAVALWLDERRVTEDIDIFGIGDQTEPRWALMDFALSRGLPVEALNSAADFFVRRIDGWRGEMVLLREGRLGRVFRPSATLLVLSKVARLSERDLLDCLAAIDDAHRNNAPFDSERVRSALDALPAGSEPSTERRAALAEALDTPCNG